jgi:hypothetical protein
LRAIGHPAGMVPAQVCNGGPWRRWFRSLLGRWYDADANSELGVALLRPGAGSIDVVPRFYEENQFVLPHSGLPTAEILDLIYHRIEPLPSPVARDHDSVPQTRLGQCIDECPFL